MPAVDCKITMESQNCYILRVYDDNVLTDAWECKSIEIDPITLQHLIEENEHE